MKGVVLAGGRGTRLRPTTRVVNKHVLPVYDQPMIFYPVRTLQQMGIDDIIVISGSDHISEFTGLLEAEFDANFRYQVQTEAKGIADGVRVAQEFVDEDFVVLLGDNIFFDNLTRRNLDLEGSAKIFLKKVDDPSRFGVASVNDGRISSLDEKPESPDGKYAVVGAYRYTSDVFQVIEGLELSERGEYEISDVNEHYLHEGELEYEIIDGYWFDAGTPEGLFRAATEVRERRNGTVD